MAAFPFNDLLEPGNPIKVLARVSMLSAESGGRTTPLTGAYSYRPNHNFGGPEGCEFYIGQVAIPGDTTVHPGETHDLVITFLNGRDLSNLLQVGRLWRIQEGPKLVATAQVLAIVCDA